MLQAETGSHKRTRARSLAQRVRPDCGVARAVIAGQTADQRGNLNLRDVGGKKKPQTLETGTQTHHTEPQHSNTIHYSITEHMVKHTPLLNTVPQHNTVTL